MGLKRILACAAMGVCVLGASGGHPEPAAATGHGKAPAPAAHAAATPAMTPEQALATLTEGNARFAAGTLQDPRRDQARRCDTFANGQHPIAAVLSCADSRVPAELVFDQGIGDLVVIRVAGNVADTDEVGTIEYGVGHLGTPLVVVLGHTKCGAVTAVAEKQEVHGCIGQLVDNIVPAVEKASKLNPSMKGPALVASAIRQNVWQSIEDMYGRSETVRDAAKAGKVKVVGALYDLHNGTVEWMGPHPEEKRLLAGGKSEKPVVSKPKPVDKPAKAAEHGAGHGDGHSNATEAGKAEAEQAEGSHGPASPATQPTAVLKKENYLALGGLVGGASVVAGIAIRFTHKRG